MLPSSVLRPFVKQLWISESAGEAGSAREHVLPTGEMHLVFRLAGPPLRIYRDADDRAGSLIDGPVVGGVRNSFYIKEIGAPVRTAGVQLLPGAAQSLFGVSAAELAGRHTPLSELWGGQANSMLEQIAAAPGAQQALAKLDALLAARAPHGLRLHPVVAEVLADTGHGWNVEAMVRASRYSHRGFIALFKQATGLSPKRYARLMRFQYLLGALRASADVPLGQLALDAGYSDQAHMNREFREYAGSTPLQYRLLAPAAANHLPVKFVQDGARHGSYSGGSNQPGSTP